MTKIFLMHRHYGVHRPVKEFNLPGKLEQYYDKKLDKVNEQAIINDLPENWLPATPNNVLVTTSENGGSTGHYDLNLFRPWAKYFDAYCINIILDGEREQE